MIFLFASCSFVGSNSFSHIVGRSNHTLNNISVSKLFARQSKSQSHTFLLDRKLYSFISSSASGLLGTLTSISSSHNHNNIKVFTLWCHAIMVLSVFITGISTNQNLSIDALSLSKPFCDNVRGLYSNGHNSVGFRFSLCHVICSI
jgi:hypothetical protein